MITVPTFAQEGFFKLCGTGTVKQISDAIAAGAAVTKSDSHGMTPIMYAAISNPDPAVIPKLIQAGASLKSTDAGGQTLLLLAAEFNPNPEIMKLLVKLGSSISEKGSQGTPVLLGALIGDKSDEVISWLVRSGSSATDTDAEGKTALTVASEFNHHPEVIADLVAAGAKVSSSDASGALPMALAASWNSNPEILVALMNAGAKLDPQDIVLAAKTNRSPDIIKFLVKNGIPVDTPDKAFSETPLEAAITYGMHNDTVIASLVEAGASVKKDSGGFTPLMLAVGGGSHSFENRLGIVKLLMNAGASVADSDPRGDTPLLYAARGSSSEIIDLLLAAGAKITERDQKGMTPILFAAEFNTAGVVEDLVKNGAGLEETNDEGMTPLLMVVTRNSDRRAAPENQAVLSALIQSGASAKAKNNKGDSALTLAIKNTDGVETVKQLLNAGASADEPDASGMTPLLSAVSLLAGTDILAALAERTSLDARTSDGRTALMIATTKRNHDAVKLLLAGSKLEAKDNEGSTALMCAVAADDVSETRDLIQDGADVSTARTDGTTLLISALKTKDAELIKLLLDSKADPSVKDASGWSAFDYAHGDEALTASLTGNSYKSNAEIQEVHHFPFRKPFYFLDRLEGDSEPGLLEMFFLKSGLCLVGTGWNMGGGNEYIVFDKNWNQVNELKLGSGRFEHIFSARYLALELSSEYPTKRTHIWIYPNDSLSRTTNEIELGEYHPFFSSFLTGNRLFSVDFDAGGNLSAPYSWELSRNGKLSFHSIDETVDWLSQNSEKIGGLKNQNGNFSLAHPGTQGFQPQMRYSDDSFEADLSTGRPVGLPEVSWKELRENSELVGKDSKGLVYLRFLLPWKQVFSGLSAYCYAMVDPWSKKVIFRNLNTRQHVETYLEPEAISPNGDLYFFDVDREGGQYTVNRIVNDWWDALGIRATKAGTVNDNRVRIRTEPNQGASIADYLYENETVRILETSSKVDTISGVESPWYRITSSDGRHGWVFGGFVNID
jgi:ankyrin repeat protein